MDKKNDKASTGMTDEERRAFIKATGKTEKELLELVLGEMAERCSEAGRERIRQVEAKALRKLRHPSLSRRFRPPTDK